MTSEIFGAVYCSRSPLRCWLMGSLGRGGSWNRRGALSSRPGGQENTSSGPAGEVNITQEAVCLLPVTWDSCAGSTRSRFWCSVVLDSSSVTPSGVLLCVSAQTGEDTFPHLASCAAIGDLAGLNRDIKVTPPGNAAGLQRPAKGQQAIG